MRSFRNRLLVLIIGLIVATQTVTLFAVSASMARSVQARAASQLRTGSTLVEQLIRFRGIQLASGVRVLAADFGFREAVASRDRDTILSALENHAERIHADFSVMVDRSGALLAATGAVDPGSAAGLSTLVEEPKAGRDRAHFLVVNGRPYQFFISPVRAPETIGWVAMGFAIDDALAREIRDLVGAEVTLVALAPDRSPSVASTLGAAGRAEIGRRAAGFDEVQPDPHELPIGHESNLAIVRQLEARSGGLWVVLTMSMYEVMAPFREVRAAIMLIGGTALVLALIMSVLLGRGAARPIDRLVLGARRIEDGDYTQRIEPQGGVEFERLASTLNAMQEGIAEREARITHQAHHDRLTGLPNRPLALQRIDTMLHAAKSSGAGLRQQAALILLELRNFSEINASLGHEVGDQVLLEIAARLKHATRASDLVARLGATQFLVAVAECPRDYAVKMAGQFCAAMRAGVRVEQATLDLEAAAGVCFAPEHGREAAELLRRAEVAVQDATVRGVDVALFEPARDLEQKRRLRLVADLREAIQQDALTLVYQPKALMATHRVTGVEALVRWTHPELGAISPAEFVPLAEQSGSSRPLTRWVIARALRQMAEWRATGLQVDVALNLSAPDVVDPELVAELLDALERHRVPASSLVLEITESAVMRDFEAAARNMQRLQLAGIRFAIDDFGTGHSSLSQLQRLPVDELKIDRSFVMHADERHDDEAIVHSTIELAHSMGMHVVAEGIESGSIWTLLSRLGCDYAQGYFLSKPLPAADLAAFVAQANSRLADAASATAQVRVLEEFRSSR